MNDVTTPVTEGGNHFVEMVIDLHPPVQLLALPGLKLVCIVDSRFKYLS